MVARDWEMVLPQIPEGTSIPRLIHQTFASKTLPPMLLDNLDAMRRNNPSWEHRLYDDADITLFIDQNYGAEVLRAYERLEPRYGPARADLFRYLLLYRLGGVYLDIKSTLSLPLDEIIRPGDRYLLSHWPDHGRTWGWHSILAHVPGGEFVQWYIACAPGHPFLRAVIVQVLGNIERYNAVRDGVGRRGVLTVTGPIAYTLAIAPLLGQHPHRMLEDTAGAGLLYSMMGEERPRAHEALFRNHYTRLKLPVVRRGALETWAVVVAVTLRRMVRAPIQAVLGRRTRRRSG